MKKLLLLFIFVCMILPASLHAATFHFSPIENVAKGGEAVVDLLLDTKGEIINAVSGKISLPSFLNVTKILTGSSTVLLWIDQPHVSDGVLSFSGITPGGFRGDKEIFSIVLNPQEEKQFSLVVSEPLSYRNDAKGSSATTTSSSETVSVVSGTTTSIVLNDTVPPEQFPLLISSDPIIFNGANFISFVAQDKGSGVAKYEWAHTFVFSPDKTDWQTGESPIPLSFWENFERIFVKAVDMAGNERVVEVSGSYRYPVIIFGGIIIALVLCVLSLYARHSSSRRSS